MNIRRLLTSCFTAIGLTLASAQQTDAAALLEVILKNYYKNEKPVYKGRQQLLFFYCDKANNNEEIFETVQQLRLPPAIVKQIRAQVDNDKAHADWKPELEQIYAKDHTRLSIKINDCLKVEEYYERRARLNLNNQRLMIVSKPILYDNNKKALVKVVFYRSVEHNNGSVLLMEKSNGNWTIKDFLNSWST